jgi:SAM-dependent methyltransferase
VSKRDEDSDMEVGMTTAERRRRRRRGAGLRVPSDNVPRRAPTAPPVAPVPEDPALSMSIAYSFTNDASGPMRTVDPVAPDAMPTLIEPPNGNAIESADFEMKTREMSAVDLKALGIDDPNSASTTLRMDRQADRQSAPKIVKEAERSDRMEVDVDVTLDADAPDEVTTEISAPSITIVPAPPVTPPKVTSPPMTAPLPLAINAAARLKTVALSDEDLEEVRAQTQPTTQMAAQTPPADFKPTTPPGGVVPPGSRSSQISVPPPMPRASRQSDAPLNKSAEAGAPAPRKENPATRTQELQALDIEILNKDEPMSVPEIDIQELSDRAGESGEIVVETKPAEPRRPDKPSDKPPDRQTPVQKAPPAPPPKKATPVPGAVATVAAPGKADPNKPGRGKPWFVDLFDEDYLRTLPFLTSQATQAEAEFVLEAMSLQPGAQVLDVGCGYGRHAMELAARGLHVVGLDLSTPLLVRGGEEAHRRGLTINFVRGDMRELDFENQFDGAYCLFSTFGYFDDETNKKALINMARALKPGGKVLIEILNRDYIIADLPTRVWWEGEGCVVLEEVELNYFSSRIQVNRSVVFDDGRQLEQEISVRAYSLHEVGKLMHAAGFRVLEVSGGYQTRGRFFGNQSRHIIVLAERKETSGS